MLYPKTVLIREDGPREGFQSYPFSVPVEKKRELILALIEAGAPSIEVTAFVHPEKVPQHADAEELLRDLKEHSPETHACRLRGLYLNPRGFERAYAQDLLHPETYLLTGTSETFLKENMGQSTEDNFKNNCTLLQLFQERGLSCERIMLSTAFGDVYEGIISPERCIEALTPLLHKVLEQQKTSPEITLADTVGYAHPDSLSRCIEALRTQFPETPLGLHLHDTRGLGIANVLRGLEMGIDRFDASIGGMGGCPFAPGAAGNVATEELVYLCESLGIQTGYSLKKTLKAAHFAQSLIDRPLPSKLIRSNMA